MVPSRVLRISPIVVSQPSCTGGAKRCRRLFQWDPNSTDDDNFDPDDDVLVEETSSVMASNLVTNCVTSKSPKLFGKVLTYYTNVTNLLNSLSMISSDFFSLHVCQ